MFLLMFIQVSKSHQLNSITSANRNVTGSSRDVENASNLHLTNIIVFFLKTHCFLILKKMHGQYLKETYLFNLAMFVLTINMFYCNRSYRDRRECVLSKPGSNFDWSLGVNKWSLPHQKISDFTTCQLQMCLLNRFLSGFFLSSFFFWTVLCYLVNHTWFNGTQVNSKLSRKLLLLKQIQQSKVGYTVCCCLRLKLHVAETVAFL